MPHDNLWGAKAERREFGEKHWNEPLKWNKKAADAGERHRVFCASMADVFDKNAPEGARNRLLKLIANTPNLDWLILTKRIGNAKEMLDDAMLDLSYGSFDWTDESALPNLWLGASIVNQEEANRDIPKLLQVPAAVRFLSMEPLLGAVDVSRYMPRNSYYMTKCEHCGWICSSHLCGTDFAGDDVVCPACVRSIRGDDAPGLDWIIVGGESGPQARTMHPDWVRSLRDQCTAAGVPFLFKQWGEWREPLEGEEYDTTMGRAQRVPAFIVAPTGTVHCFENNLTDGNGRVMLRVGKKAAGRLLDGVQHDGYPRSAA